VLLAVSYLQEAVKHCEYWRLADSKNKAPGLIGWWPQRSVTFVDNHDTGGPALAASAAADGWQACLVHVLVEDGVKDATRVM
jgi:alpha-amylase